MLRLASLSLPLVLLMVVVLSAGEEPQQTAASPAPVTDAAHAGPDFAVQGDWVGTAPYKGKDVKYVVQIVALSDGKFHGVGYYGGLPSDGWDTKTKLEADGQSQDGVTVFKRNDSTSTYAIAGDAALALAHAQACLATIEAHAGEPEADAFARFYAHEALAWAHRAGSDVASASAQRARMVALMADLPADLRSWCEAALRGFDAAG